MEYKEIIILCISIFLGSLIGQIIGTYIGFRYAVKKSEKHKKGVIWEIKNDKDFPRSDPSAPKPEIVTRSRQMRPRGGYSNNNRRPPQR